MKKVVGIVLACIMVLGLTGMIFADEMIVMEEETVDVGVDLASMSLDDLVALKKAISLEINSRLGGDDFFTAGTYYAGTDIKAATFLIENLDDESDFFNYYIYDSLEDQNNWNDSASGTVKGGKNLTVNLKDGQILVIDYLVNGTIREVQPSYAP